MELQLVFTFCSHNNQCHGDAVKIRTRDLNVKSVLTVFTS